MQKSNDPKKLMKKIDSLITKMEHSKAIKDRLQIQEQITGYLFYLMEEESKLQSAYKVAYQTRRIEEAKYVLKYEGAISKGKETAPYACKEYRMEEATRDAEYESIKLFRFSVQHFIETTKQTNSFLKYEYTQRHEH